MSEGGPGDCRDRNRLRPRLRLPRALGLGRLRTDPLDDCLENWRENWRPRGRDGQFLPFRVVQRKALGPSWVGETQVRELFLEMKRHERDQEGPINSSERERTSTFPNLRPLHYVVASFLTKKHKEGGKD